jgi:hypothetical protein
MTKLELSKGDTERLIDVIDNDIAAWEDELDRAATEELFDTWEQLLEATAFAGEMLTFLIRLRRKLDGRAGTTCTIRTL